MNTKNLLIASLIGGVLTTFLTNVPIINLLNCLLCAGFWVGPLGAAWFYKRQSGAMTLGQGVLVGTVAGVWAGVFGFILSFVGGAGTEALMQSYSQFLPPDAGVQLPDFGVLSVVANLVGVAFTIFFGVIGGLIGGALFKTAPTAPSAPTPMA